MGVEEDEIDMRVAVGSVDEAVDARQALSVRSAELASQRRLALQAEHTLVKRDPRDMASAIALGFVCVRLGLRAADSWKLEGLLSERVGSLVERLNEAAAHLGTGEHTGGEALVRALDLGGPELAAQGEFEAWNRRARRYFDEHEQWLEADLELRRSGKWRFKKMSTGQQELIRQTCALFEIDLPGHLTRGSAHDWLSQYKANLLYRGVGI